MIFTGDSYNTSVQSKKERFILQNVKNNKRLFFGTDNLGI